MNAEEVNMGKSCYIYAGTRSSGAISYFSVVTASGCLLVSQVTLWDATFGGNMEAPTVFCACTVKSVCTSDTAVRIPFAVFSITFLSLYS